MKRAIILLLDSFGIGASADAEKFGDAGADTFGHIAEACAKNQAGTKRTKPLQLPNLTALGLYHAAKASTGLFHAGFNDKIPLEGAYGYAKSISTGKDTSSGHWEIAGVPVLSEWGYFTRQTETFPPELLKDFIEKAGLPGVLGNCHASGTEIIAAMGKEHCRTGKPIVYTSADSVFQIACHETTFGLNRLYEICQISRELVNPYNIGRVIARPFTGEDANSFMRTGNRHDYAVKPPEPTLLDKLVNAGGQVTGIGKIADIYAHCGITEEIRATGLEELFDKTVHATEKAKDHTLVFTNFVDFDSSYGHRRDTGGYADALEYFDRRLPELRNMLQKEDLLIITADHGCDPTFPGSDHTREHVPVLFSGPKVSAVSLGERQSFADMGQTLADYFNLSPMNYGVSFKDVLFP